MLAVAARICDPLDSNTLTKLDWGCFCVVSNGDDFTDAFVAADKRCHGCDWPVPLADMKIRVTDPRADHLDKTLARVKLGWLCDGDIALYHHGLLGAGYDSGDLCLWDLAGHRGW